MERNADSRSFAFAHVTWKMKRTKSLQALSEAAGRARPLRHLSRLPPRRAVRHQRQRRPDHQSVGVPLNEAGDNLGGIWANNIGTYLTHCEIKNLLAKFGGFGGGVL